MQERMRTSRKELVMKFMAIKARNWSLLIGSIVVVMFVGSSLMASSGQADSGGVSSELQPVTIIVGESRIVSAPWPTVRVAVTDPKIVNVQVLTPEQVLLQALKVGSTDLILWSEGEKEVWQRKVVVRIDTDSFKETLDGLFPLSLLETSQSGDVLIVKGLLRSTEQATQLHNYLDKVGVSYVDMTSVAGIQQVQLQVRVAEVSRTALRTMGMNAFYANENVFGAARVGSASGGALVPSINIGPPEGTVAGGDIDFTFNQAVTAGPLITLFAGFPKADFEFFLQALAENQFLRLLANPTLVALSGEQAIFLAGGEFPIPVVQGGSGGAGGSSSVTIQYREYGVRLLFQPVVLGDGTIRLHASQEVSDLTSVGAVTIEGFEVPALLTRKAETTLELKSGQTFAMAGLIKHKSQAVKSRVPWLGDVPVLGTLFRSMRYAEEETELVILVTASLVEPMSLAAVPPLPGFLHSKPNDWELYLDGRIESKEPAAIDPATAEWFKKRGIDNLLGPGAWDSYNKPVSSNEDQITKNNPDTEDTEKEDSEKPEE